MVLRKLAVPKFPLWIKLGLPPVFKTVLKEKNGIILLRAAPAAAKPPPSLHSSMN